jgi:hypothetical protein
MKRKALLDRIISYDSNDLSYIKHAIDILNTSDNEDITNDEIGDIWERISKALDVKFSDDESHDAWALESELSKAYQRN